MVTENLTEEELAIWMRLARQLALAHHVERMVESGAIRNHAAVARVLGVTRARIAQVMGLLHLSPDIQQFHAGFPIANRFSDGHLQQP